MKMFSKMNRGGSSHICLFPRKAARREAAVLRQACYDALPLDAKVAQAGLKELHKFVKRGGEGAILAQKILDQE